MRVVALTHVFPRAETDPNAPFLLTWARALRAAGVEVVVVAPHDAGLPSAQQVDGIPVRLARYAPKGWERMAYRGEMHQLVRSPLGPPLIAALICSLVRTTRAELRNGAAVLHVHWWVPGAIAARLARPRVPVVVTLHGTDVALLEGRPRLAVLARWALRVADRIEVVSTDLAERLERATGLHAHAVNPMPLEPSWFTPTTAGPAAQSGPARVLAVGRMVPEKGFADLVAAVALLEAPVLLELIGDGPELARLRAQAAGLGVALETPGRLAPSALRAAYSRADVVAQPSHREGLGLVAAEAVLSGTPVVATDSGGVRDLLPREWLVPPGDRPALAARLAAVLADPAGARAGLAPVVQRLRERLAPPAAATRTLDAYRTLTRGVSDRRRIRR